MVMTEGRERRIVGVKVEGPDDLSRVVSALGNAGEKGSAEYAVARRDLIHAARELGEVKALPADWGVTEDEDGTEYKAFPAAATNIVDEAQGIVEAFVAVSGTEDKVADIIYPEALDYALKDRTPKAVWHHEWKQPIGKTLEAKALPPGDPQLPAKQRNGEAWPASAGALWVKSQFNLGTTRGKDAFNDVVFFGDDQEWSIGYRVPRGGAKVDKFGVRHIKQLVIPEYSPVLFGAHPLTSTASVKHELAGPADPEPEPEEKAETKSGTIRLYLTGSDEERIDRITDAIEEWLAGADSGIDMQQCMARVVGTFADRVVFCVMTFDDYGGEPGDETPDLDEDDNYFQADYTYTGGVATLGTVSQVDISTTVTVKADDGPVELKVGKMFSRANLQKLKAAANVLSDLLTMAEPPKATAAAKADAEQPHPYVADNGRCATCQLSGTAAVHKLNTLGKVEVEEGSVSDEVKAALRAAGITLEWKDAAPAAPTQAEQDAMKKKPHPYVASDAGDGTCATCGAAKASPMHTTGKAEGLPPGLVAAMLERERLAAEV